MTGADAHQREQIADLVARCVQAFEASGDDGVAAELATHGELAGEVRRQLDVLRAAGLLVTTELPESVGPYRLLHKLGGGGMGSVYLCEQDAPIRRRVAVKLIRPGMDSSEVLARFQVERQALALLEHQHIAKVLDAGTAANGRPFLVMEYVPGLPVTKYCDERQLDTAARLRLFLRICDAVQHAHHKGILHRDLKPSNLLVVDRDGAPFPVVIDFGVAKAVGGALRGATMLTLPGRLLGTPEYMSPEQATNEQDVDTRTDVYGLGVVLYELLTGTLPIESKILTATRDLAKTLNDVEPPPPSARITRMTDGGSVAAQRRSTDVATLRRALRGDLDWIVLRALAKDRNRRYGMPAELAADLLRHLAGEPVLAGPPSRWYRFRKYVGRHRLQVGAAATVLAVLAGGLTTSLVFYGEAAAAEAQARSSADRLHQSLETALTALDHIVGLGADGLRAMPQGEGLRRDLLRSALELHQRLGQLGERGDPRLTAALAVTLVRAARLHLLLAEPDDARSLLQRSEQSLAELPEATRSRRDLLPQTALTSYLIGDLHGDLGDREVSQRYAVDARRLYETWHALAPADRTARLGLIRSLHALSDCLTGEATGPALDLLRRAEPMARQFATDPGATHEERLAGVHAMVRLAWLLTEIGDPSATAAFTFTHEVTNRRLAATTAFPERLDYVPVLNQLVGIGFRRSDWGPTAADLELEIGLLRQATAAMPGEAGNRAYLAEALALQCLLRGDEQPPAITESTEREAIQLEEEYFRLLGNSAERGDRLIARLVDYCATRIDWLDQGSPYREQVDLAFVRRAMARAEELRATMPQAYLNDRHGRETWSQAFRVRARLLLIDGRPGEALRELQTGMAFAARLVADHPGVVQACMIRAELQLAAAHQMVEIGDGETALRTFNEVAEQFLSLQGRYNDPAAFWRRAARSLDPWLKRFVHDEAAARLGDAPQTLLAGAANVARCAKVAAAATASDRGDLIGSCIALLRRARACGGDLSRLGDDETFAALRQVPDFADLLR